MSRSARTTRESAAAVPLLPYQWRWQFNKPWKVASYHDSTITPGAKKLITPYGMIVALVSEGHGGNQPKIGTFFEVQFGARVFTGWCYAVTLDAALQPNKEFAKQVIRQVFRRFPRERSRYRV